MTDPRPGTEGAPRAGPELALHSRCLGRAGCATWAAGAECAGGTGGSPAAILLTPRSSCDRVVAVATRAGGPAGQAVAMPAVRLHWPAAGALPSRPCVLPRSAPRLRPRAPFRLPPGAFFLGGRRSLGTTRTVSPGLCRRRGPPGLAEGGESPGRVMGWPGGPVATGPVVGAFTGRDSVSFAKDLERRLPGTRQLRDASSSCCGPGS